VRMKLGQTRQRGISGASATGNLVEPLGADPLGVSGEAEEVLEKLDGKPKGHQRQLTLNSNVETMAGPMSPARQRGDPLGADDDFE